VAKDNGLPLKPAKPWVPDLLFDDPVKSARAPSPPVADANEIAQNVIDPATPTTMDGDGTTKTVDRVAAIDQMAAPETSLPPDTSLPEDREELARRLTAQEKALRDLRVRCRNLQDEIAKAKHTVMFCGRDKMMSAKGALEALTNEHQQGEAEERRLMSETLMLRARIERSRR